MRIRICDGDIHLTNLRTRMPFKYGIATMTTTPHAFVRLWVEVDGYRHVGLAADHLPPKWFTKDPAKPLADEVAEMLRVIKHALTRAISLEGDSPFTIWRELYQAQTEWGKVEHLPPLLSNFGTTLIERAMIEAFCRACGRPFAQVLRENLFGIQLGVIHPPLIGRRPAEFLPEQPLARIFLRHTVGLADPLVDADIAPADRCRDGLPQSLAACIDAYGLRHFKVKVNGQIDHDIERLHRVADVIERHATTPDYLFSLDGNEQSRSVAEFQEFWQALGRSPKLQAFLKHLYFVEQPWHRDVALDPAAMGGLQAWAGRPPIIIDESDATLESLPVALSLGYAGTSHKNCKGVFKSVANACLLAQLQRDQRARAYIMSGEDLCNIGPVALLQDLAVTAALGISSVERNGHHYFAGLSMFPTKVQEQVLASHADLYHASSGGWPTLTIENGLLELASVNQAPLGVGLNLDVEQFAPVEAWPAEQLPNQ